MILRQSTHDLQALLTVDREFSDLVYIHESTVDGSSGPIGQLVVDLQSNDDGSVPITCVGIDFDFRDALDLLLERESSDCRSLLQRVRRRQRGGIIAHLRSRR